MGFVVYRACLLGVRHALLLAAFAGLLEVIPYFGAFLGAAPRIARLRYLAKSNLDDDIVYRRPAD